MDYDPNKTTARVREWKYLTGRDFAEMDRANTVAVVSCSPLEVHGPHLPTITDNQEAEGLTLRIMEILCERYADIQFVHLPPVYVACDVLPHPGSVMFRPSTCRAVVQDMGRSLVRQGFRHIWMGSFHGGPRHFLGMEAAADHVNRKYGGKMVSVF
ncbi:MAG: creatininase family protein, partial [Myxococcota bacterium]